jgi:hypothetical protein
MKRQSADFATGELESGKLGKALFQECRLIKAAEQLDSPGHVERYRYLFADQRYRLDPESGFAATHGELEIIEEAVASCPSRTITMTRVLGAQIG